MRLDDHFGNGSILQRNERVKLAASFWNNAADVDRLLELVKAQTRR